VPEQSLTEAGHPARPQEAVALGLEAEKLAARLPPLLVEAERLSSIVGLGVHGRRKAGIGETFWQFRRYAQGDGANTVDWRQSAKSQHLFVREREWEAVEAIWFWCDPTAGMRFSSDRNLPTKFGRGNLLALALASLLVRGGERIALLGKGRAPAGGRVALNQMAHMISELPADENPFPPNANIGRNAQIVWFGDFLSPIEEMERAIRKFAGAGLFAHLVHIMDPAEQDFPYSGRTRFEWSPSRRSELLGRAESVREEYRRRFRAQAESVNALARGLGWTYLAHRTDHRPETALVALYARLGGAPTNNIGARASA
jgi:uncharacterized protein (DUF58 family)